MTFTEYQQAALADDAKFSREHPALFLAALEKARKHYEGMAAWRRSDLEQVLEENWPLFVEKALYAGAKP